MSLEQNMELLEVAKAQLEAQKLQSEIRIHRSMHHPNIVQFENFFEDEENVYIIMEICTNSTLNE